MLLLCVHVVPYVRNSLPTTLPMQLYTAVLNCRRIAVVHVQEQGTEPPLPEGRTFAQVHARMFELASTAHVCSNLFLQVRRPSLPFSLRD